MAARAGTRAYLIESVNDVRPEWIAGCTRIGVTAGASTPNRIVEEVIRELRGRGYSAVDEVTVVEEDVQFSLPRTTPMQLTPFRRRLASKRL